MEFTLLLKNGKKQLVETENLSTLFNQFTLDEVSMWIKGNELDLYEFLSKKWIYTNDNIIDGNEIVTDKILLKNGFEKTSEPIGWAKFSKNGFELVEIPLKKGGFIIGFEYTFCSQTKYKFPLKTQELNQLYTIIIGVSLFDYL